ncbi:LPD29 domain-containing protein [Xanthomonas hydrangeae]|uniref:LPD29 domain-containing protein n=1 Tax=Xanthomonas hydrangeae TaxID=2775159 RepID=UPI003516B5AD
MTPHADCDGWLLMQVRAAHLPGEQAASQNKAPVQTFAYQPNTWRLAVTTSHISIEIGQRVVCRLGNRGPGIVVRSYDSIFHAAPSIVRVGNTVRFDVVFADGSQFKKLTEAALRNVQWDVLPQIADAVEVASAIELAQHYELSAIDAKAKDEADREATAAGLRADPTLKHLVPITDGERYDTTRAAANIRRDLKKAFPGTKFSVRTPNHNHIKIQWEDGPCTDDVDTVSKRYKLGSFDTYTDCYAYRRSAWCDVFGGAEHVHTARSSSDALITYAIEFVQSQYAHQLGSVVPTVSEYRRGCYWNVPVASPYPLADDLNSLIRAVAYRTAVVQGRFVTAAA